ncbi:glycosyl hydrolase family 76-domain-containing protein [Limtongia smithiae]|uniref:glycosyl hydrolase family 76-domain-containing protein n=1 Tax=Limtongia smithiae TaxID=1125753 RepID=UPI0034CFEED6
MIRPFRVFSSTLLLVLVLAARVSAGVTLDINDEDSIKTAAQIVADGLMNYYHGDEYGGTPGLFTGGYYWWESGAAWGSLIDYWFYTGDDTYSDIIEAGLLFQVGSDDNYEPANQTSSLGNDDQGFWGITVMAAAERNFTNPASDEPQWLALAQAVFNSIALTWSTDSCGGGIRWQKFLFNDGYDYKNSIANGVLFHLGARLARYTGNSTYAEWAEKVWNWEVDIGLISDEYFVYDGTYVDDNCTSINEIQWTYNLAIYVSGCAYLYNYTSSLNSSSASTWKTRLDGLISSSDTFLSGTTDIIYEPACEPSANCDTDQQSFKAYMARFYGLTIQLAPYTWDTLWPVLQASATAAAATCNGGTDNVTCGYTWLTGTYDGSYGLGEQMAALEVIQSQLIPYSDAPYTNTTGGSSTGDASLGSGGDSADDSGDTITTKDKIGAWAATACISVGVLGFAVWCSLSGQDTTRHISEWIRLDDM